MNDRDRTILSNIKAIFKGKFGRPSTLNDETLLIEFNEMNRGGMTEQDIFDVLRDKE